MKKFIVTAGIIFGFCSFAQAAVQTYTYNSPAPTYYNSYLNELNHDSYYTWGIKNTKLGDDIRLDKVKITSATIEFKNIYNWQREDYYQLYVQLLDYAALGVTEKSDTKTGNEFDGNGKELVEYQKDTIPAARWSWYQIWDESKNDWVWTELGTIKFDIVGDNLALLNQYAEDGIFGLGFDPDCHFYDCGIKLNITTGDIPTDAVPEPATMVLFGTGLIGLAGLRMRRKKS